MKMFRKNNKSKTLQQKLLFRILILAVVLLCALGFYQFNNMKKYLYGSKIEFLDSRFKNVNKEIILGTNSEEMLNKNSTYILEKISVDEVAVAIINDDGDVIAAKNNYTGILTETSQQKDQNIVVPVFSKEDYLKIMNSNTFAKGYSIFKDDGGKNQIVIWRQLGSIESPSGLVQISTYLESSNKILFEQTKVFILSAIFILIIGAALIIAVVKHTLIPLKDTADKIEKIDENTLHIRLNEKSGLIEIDKLDIQFNKMLEKLQLALVREKVVNEKMKNFILDASHELRTPLTSIKGFIEVLQNGGAKSEDHLNMALSSMLEESDRLGKLVENLLRLIKLEDNLQTNFETVDLSSIVKEIEPQLKILIKERELKLILHEGNYSSVNKDQIKQIIYNLVQNAVNYTDENKGEITIKVQGINKNNLNYVQLAVKDNGVGINKEKLNYIFDRFYRADSHRARKKGGYGLGLSIVKAIVNNHKGEISVESEEGKGTEFIILLKKK